MSIRRTIKNVVNNFSDAQVKVREATSNDPWGPSSTIMSEIADLTYNVMAYTDIMQMIWKRLNDKNKNWRHVYKAMVLLEYIIKTGSEKVAQQCRENIFAIQSLGDFQFVDENKDHGLNVREKAKQLVLLLKDNDKLREERAKALKAKERLQLTSGMIANGAESLSEAGVGVELPTKLSVQPNLESDENAQMQLALEISRKEHKEDKKRRQEEEVQEETKLRIAIEASKKEEANLLAPLRPPPYISADKKEALDSNTTNKHIVSSKFTNPSAGTLLDLIDTSLSVAPVAQADPWAKSAPVTKDDPWSSSVLPQSTPWPEPVVTATVGDEYDLLSDFGSISVQAPASTLNGDSNHGLVADSKLLSSQFLGEHANLVSLDNLVSKPTNPFAFTSSSMQTSQTIRSYHNPFAVPAPSSKISLNDLQQQQQQQQVQQSIVSQTFVPKSASCVYQESNNPWSAISSMQTHAPAASINPFL